MRLTIKTKPKKLTLGQMWQLYSLDSGHETPEFIITLLDFSFPGMNREDMSITDRFTKYREVRPLYDVFSQMIKGMVGNGE